MAAPVKHTCPDIDKVIKSINDLLEIAKKWEDESYYNEVEYYLYDIPDKLEKLRDSNSSLRDWGEEIEKELIELSNSYAAIADEYEELKANLIEMNLN
jgi:archaellum component FlaC